MLSNSRWKPRSPAISDPRAGQVVAVVKAGVAVVAFRVVAAALVVAVVVALAVVAAFQAVAVVVASPVAEGEEAISPAVGLGVAGRAGLGDEGWRSRWRCRTG